MTQLQRGLPWLGVLTLLACGPPMPGAPDIVTEGSDVVAVSDVLRNDAVLPSDDAALATLTETVTTGSNGEIEVVIPVTNHRSFLLNATTETNAKLALVDLRDPSGNTVLRWQDWYNGNYSLTFAFWATVPVMAVNWPIREQDPPLVPGMYRARIGSYRADGITARPDIPLQVTTILRRDENLAQGTVRVVLVYAQGLGDDTALVTATEAAVAHWREVWAGAGMTLELRYVRSSITPILPYPGPDSGPVLGPASALAEPGEIAVVLGEVIDNSASLYGVSGGVPGPMVSSGVSGIVVGWLANAGGDGVFSSDDVRLYGEVLAHEVGHYVGLSHPVSRTYDYWDALDDTPECRNRAACESMLGTNLMYPTSICSNGVCVSTTVITAGQQGIMQRYTGTQ